MDSKAAKSYRARAHTQTNTPRAPQHHRHRHSTRASERHDEGCSECYTHATRACARPNSTMLEFPLQEQRWERATSREDRGGLYTASVGRDLKRAHASEIPCASEVVTRSEDVLHRINHQPIANSWINPLPRVGGGRNTNGGCLVVGGLSKLRSGYGGRNARNAVVTVKDGNAPGCGVCDART